MNTKIAFDYETTGFDPITKKVFSYVFTDEDFNSVVYDIDGKDRVKNLQILKDFFDDPSIEKIAHNFKFELHFTLRSLGITPHPETIWHDTMIMSQIVNNLEHSHKLEDLTSLYCTDRKLRAFWKETDRKIRFQAKARGNRYDRVDRPLMNTYQENDGMRTMLLFQLFFEQIQPFWENYRWEMDLIEATQRMEDFGLQPSVPNITLLKIQLGEQVADLTNQLFWLLKGFYNFNSDDTIRKYLYDLKGFPIYGETDKGLPSVDKEVFFKLRDNYPEDKPTFDLILKYRSYLKGISMMNNYLSFIHPEDGLIHHNINTNSAVTGRQTANKPNMQNVAKDNALKNLFPIPARKSIVPRKNSILGFVDYSGIEMRLIIEAVKEPTMIKVLHNGGSDTLNPKEDIHALASSYWFGDMFTDQETCLKEYLPHNDSLSENLPILINEIGEEEGKKVVFKKARKVLRGGGKNGQFALAYGGTIDKIAQTLNLPLEFLYPGYEAYRKKFPLIANFTRDSMRIAKENGFVTTSFGRRLLIDRSRIHTASNYRIQGTGAEILKRSTVNLDRFLQKEFPDVRLMVPIHDELMSHIPNHYIPRLEELSVVWGKQMTHFPELSVPIEVEWEFSEKTWNDKVNLKDMLKRMKEEK